MAIKEAQTNAFNIVANYSSHTPDLMDRSRLPEFLNAALKKTRHIFFGEAHVNGILLKTYEMLAQDPEIFKTAAQNGVRHLAVEFSHQFQIHADRYANNEISKDQLQYALFDNMFWRYKTQWLSGDAERQFHQHFVQTIDNACSAGLLVHFADLSCEKAMTSSQPELSRMENDLKKKMEGRKIRTISCAIYLQSCIRIAAGRNSPYPATLAKFSKKLAGIPTG